jgi:hypothetical protein
MTTSTLNNDRHVSRKTLSTQIDRLDSMLDGLAENLNEAVAMAVKETVAQVVREAVEVAVKEVLSNPELLRAALAQHEPPAAPVQSAMPKSDRGSITDMLKSGWNWLCVKVTQTASQVKKTLGQGVSWCVEKVRQGCAAVWNRRKSWVAAGAGAVAALGTVGLALWQFRRSCSIALAAGLVVGVCGYLAGPLFCAMISGLGSMAITLATMLLLPFWNLLHTSKAGNPLD